MAYIAKNLQNHVFGVIRSCQQMCRDMFPAGSEEHAKCQHGCNPFGEPIFLPRYSFHAMPEPWKRVPGGSCKPLVQAHRTHEPLSVTCPAFLVMLNALAKVQKSQTTKTADNAPKQNCSISPFQHHSHLFGIASSPR